MGSLRTYCYRIIRRSCYELQSNLIMINNYVAFDHKIPNKNFMSNVKMKSMYVCMAHTLTQF
jgi:hypothetical protein